MVSQSSKVKSQNDNSKVKIELRERCYKYSIKAVRFIDTLPEKRVYWILSNQLLRSATSIGANITEAKSASSKRDFIKYYEIALKSANETTYWLGILKEALNINGNEIGDLLRDTEEISKIIAASLITMKNRK